MGKIMINHDNDDDHEGLIPVTVIIHMDTIIMTSLFTWAVHVIIINIHTWTVHMETSATL